MRSPWLDIPLADYEAHMALPTVGQARMLADTLAALVARHAPRSVAVLGCAGGNGFDGLGRAGVGRVVGLDINPRYIDAARRRYGNDIRQLELHVADIEQTGQVFAPVDFIYAALVLEYVDVGSALGFMARHCAPNGLCAALVQQPHPRLDRVSPSPYEALRALERFSRWVVPEQLSAQALRAGFVHEAMHRIESDEGKRFAVAVFRRAAAVPDRPAEA